jgi:hypothetical protein
MNGRDPQDAWSAPEGGATAAKGTPAAVPLSTSGRARSTIVLFLSGPVIWSVHFLLVYLVVEAGCTGSGEGLSLFAPPVPTVVTIVATVVAAIGCLAAAGMSHRRWRRDRQESGSRTDLAPAEGVGTLAFVGFLLAVLGFVTVLFVGLPALFLPACLP